MSNTRRPVRIAHLTMAHAVKRMLRGPFTATDLAEATGLYHATAYQYMRALRLVEAVSHTGYRKDSAGRMRIKTYTINLEAK